MFRISRKTPFAKIAAAAALVVGLTACDDDPTDVEPEPDVEAVRLVIGTTTVTISGGVVTGGPVTIPVGDTNVTATFLNSAGVQDPIAHSDEFELRIESSDDAIASFTSTGDFTGTIHGNATGSAVLDIQLFHIAEQHEDFEQPLPITVE